jgi:hypothetical protein
LAALYADRDAVIDCKDVAVRGLGLLRALERAFAAEPWSVRQPSVELVEESALVCRAPGVEEGARDGDESWCKRFEGPHGAAMCKCSNEESGADGAEEERRVRKRPAQSANDSGQQGCAGRRVCVAPDAPGRALLTAAARRVKLEERGRVGARKNGRGHVGERG